MSSHAGWLRWTQSLTCTLRVISYRCVGIGYNPMAILWLLKDITQAIHWQRTASSVMGTQSMKCMIKSCHACCKQWEHLYCSFSSSISHMCAVCKDNLNLHYDMNKQAVRYQKIECKTFLPFILHRRSTWEGSDLGVVHMIHLPSHIYNLKNKNNFLCCCNFHAFNSMACVWSIKIMYVTPCDFTSWCNSYRCSIYLE